MHNPRQRQTAEAMDGAGEPLGIPPSPDFELGRIRPDANGKLALRPRSVAELGWDMDNRLGYAEQYREGVHEDRIKVAGATKAPVLCRTSAAGFALRHFLP
jgi:hypothetical protein